LTVAKLNYRWGKQESFMVQNVLRGNYATPFRIFTAKNILDWRDVQHIEKKDGELSGFCGPRGEKRLEREEARELAEEEKWEV
jgi:hypothetical protein